MSSDRSDIWAGIGAIASSIASTYAWLYSIGLVPLFTFIAGACFTYWTQGRLERKRRERERERIMTEIIYGPLHKELNSILVSLEAFESPTGTSVEGIKKDFRFNFVKEEIRYRIKEFQERLAPYAALLNEAHREIDVHIGKSLNKHGVGGGVSFVIGTRGGESFRFSMIQPIFRDKTPLDFLTERARGYRNVSMIVYVGQKSEGVFSSEHRIHQVSIDVLARVRNDTLVQEQRRERERLLKECKSLIESIEKKIVL